MKYQDILLEESFPLDAELKRSRSKKTKLVASKLREIIGLINGIDSVNFKGDIPIDFDIDVLSDEVRSFALLFAIESSVPISEWAKRLKKPLGVVRKWVYQYEFLVCVAIFRRQAKERFKEKIRGLGNLALDKAKEIMNLPLDEKDNKDLVAKYVFQILAMSLGGEDKNKNNVNIMLGGNSDNQKIDVSDNKESMADVDSGEVDEMRAILDRLDK